MWCVVRKILRKFLLFVLIYVLKGWFLGRLVRNFAEMTASLCAKMRFFTYLDGENIL